MRARCCQFQFNNKTSRVSFQLTQQRQQDTSRKTLTCFNDTKTRPHTRLTNYLFSWHFLEFHVANHTKHKIHFTARCFIATKQESMGDSNVPGKRKTNEWENGCEMETRRPPLLKVAGSRKWRAYRFEFPR